MEPIEVWMDVPETKGQYQVGNKGHLRLMFRKAKRRHRSGTAAPLEFCSEQKPLLCEFATRRFGWLIRDTACDKKWRFVFRDVMMSLFESSGVPTNPDTSCDDAARRKSEELTAKYLAELATSDH